MQADILVSILSAAWRTEPAGAEALVDRAARAALGIAVPDRRRVVELGVRLTDNREMQALNREYRGLDRPTNVLSFPGDADLSCEDARPALLGDVVLAHDVVRSEAQAQGKAMADHLCHLTVHGVLHLLGYDHEIDSEAEAMEAAERRILKELGIADPYATPAMPVEDGQQRPTG